MENYQIQQEINIDFATPDVPPRVYAKQYDNNMRIIKANLYANGQPYTVQSGFDVNVRMAKPDGTYVYNPALEASGTYALIVLTQQMLAVAGECPAEIEVTQGSNVLSTATFVICVAADPVPENSIESTDEFKTIQEILEEVEAASKIVTDNLDAINAVSENIEAIKNAPQQAQNAANSATLAQSWAVGGTGTREGEDTDNAKYYAQIAQQVAQGGVGYYETPDALRAAHPTGQAGNWAIVGSTDTIWVWDTDTGDWVDSHGNIDLSNYYTKTEANARFSAMSSGVPTVSATKEQNYFDIELPSTNQFVIVPNAAYATGDTFRIAGRAVAAMLPNGDSLPDAFFAANAKVMCLWADTVLYFVGGGGGTMPDNIMRYRMDDGTPGQQPEQTIWGQTSDGQDAYVHSCTKAVYNQETGKTLDEEMVTMQDAPAAITGETPIKPVGDASGNVICPQTRTAAVYDPESGQTMDKVISDILKPHSLWTNPAPTSSFAAQDVAIADYDKYNMFLLVFALHTSTTTQPLSYYFGKGTGGVITVPFVGADSVVGRVFVSKENGVHFDVGLNNGQTDNSRIIPIQIFGIK